MSVPASRRDGAHLPPTHRSPLSHELRSQHDWPDAPQLEVASWWEPSDDAASGAPLSRGAVPFVLEQLAVTPAATTSVKMPPVASLTVISASTASKPSRRVGNKSRPSPELGGGSATGRWNQSNRMGFMPMATEPPVMDAAFPSRSS